MPDGLPPGGTIDVWWVLLDRATAFAPELDQYLTTEEREQANRFVHSQLGIRYRICHAVLRLLLSQYSGMRLEDLRLATGLQGKPYLTPPSPLQFNLTHCEGLALIAFTTIGQVGIDVEVMGRDVEALEIAATHYTERELRTIAAGDQTTHTERFLHIWTRKEAVLKAVGCGIGQGLDAFDVASDGVNRVHLRGLPVINPEAVWLVRDLNGLPGHAAAVAAPDEEWSIRIRELTDETLGELIRKQQSTDL